MALFARYSLPVWADDGNKAAATPWPQPRLHPLSTPDEIIQKFAAKEKEFSQALARTILTGRLPRFWSWTTPATPSASIEQTSDMTFAEDGKRMEHVVRAPVSTLKNLILTRAKTWKI